MNTQPHAVRVGDLTVGPGHSAMIVAEIGQNHNGNVDTAIGMIRAAANAGADAVKFQVGDPVMYVNPAMWSRPRDTPWGVMSYIDYRQQLRLTDDEYRLTQEAAHDMGIDWFASPLDLSAVEMLGDMDVPCYKIASPMLNRLELLRAVCSTGLPVLLSTGMSEIQEIDDAVQNLDGSPLVILHCTSAYPCPPHLINLRMIETLRQRYNVPVGYSGHEVGIPQAVAAVAMGACVIERHFTLSRAMWGSDQAASLEPRAFETMVRYIRAVESSMGDGHKWVYKEELDNLQKFRMTDAVAA